MLSDKSIPDLVANKVSNLCEMVEKKFELPAADIVIRPRSTFP